MFKELDEKSIIIINKSDKILDQSLLRLKLMEKVPGLNNIPIIFTSCVAKNGLIELESCLIGICRKHMNTSSELPQITRSRHREHLRLCSEHAKLFKCIFIFFNYFYLALSAMNEWVLAAEELRLSLLEISKITGRKHVEDLLDIIFRDFCIGK